METLNVIELTPKELSSVNAGTNSNLLEKSGFNPLDGKNWLYIDTSPTI